MIKVEDAVKEVFGTVSPREEITFQKLSELIIETRKKIEGETEEQRRQVTWLSADQII
jgi:peroxin-3